jgi:hypothetical protein
METLMATIPTERRMTQLVMFGECLVVPQWGDLDRSTRVEIVKLLAQLLLSIQAGNPSRGTQERGACDE